MPKCARCGTSVKAGETPCPGCGLVNPGMPAPRPQLTPRQLYFRFAGVLGVIVVVGGGVGAWLYRQAEPTAPMCDSASVASGVSELIHDNAVHELSPAEAVRFPVSGFAKFLNFDGSDNGARSVRRACAAVLQLGLDEPSLASVERIITLGQAARGGAGELIATSWHASERRLEIPVKFGVASAPGGGGAPWDLSVDEASVAGIRDLVRLISRASAVR